MRTILALLALAIIAAAGVQLPPSNPGAMYSGCPTQYQDGEPVEGVNLVTIEVLTDTVIEVSINGQPPKLYLWDPSAGSYDDNDPDGDGTEERITFGPEDPEHGIPMMICEGNDADNSLRGGVTRDY